MGSLASGQPQYAGRPAVKQEKRTQSGPVSATSANCGILQIRPLDPTVMKQDITIAIQPPSAASRTTSARQCFPSRQQFLAKFKCQRRGYCRVANSPTIKPQLAFRKC